MSERELILLPEDIRDAAGKILNYTCDMSLEDFLSWQIMCSKPLMT